MPQQHARSGMGIRLLAVVLVLLFLLLAMGCADFTPCCEQRKVQETQRLNDSTSQIHREALKKYSMRDETRHLLRTDTSRMMRSTWNFMRTRPQQPGHNNDNMSSVQIPLVAGRSYDSAGYLVEVHIGSPARKLRLIVDTGSDLLWTQCAPCAKCFNQLSPILHPSESSSYSAVPCTSLRCSRVPWPYPRPACSSATPRRPCRYAYAYADGSRSEGTLSTETLTLKGVGSGSGVGRDVRFRGITFGCGDSNGVSFGRADGVLGLGRGPLSLPQQIAASHGSTKFAYCLMDFSARAECVLTFGDDSEARVLERTTWAGPLQYTRIVHNPASPATYHVTVAGVRVDGAALPIDPALFRVNHDGSGGTIFDSGTTLTYLAPRIYAQVRGAVEAAVYVHYPRAEDPDGSGAGPRLESCFGAAEPVRRLRHLPSLELVFVEGSVFAPHSSNLFVDVGGGVKCLAVAEAGRGGSDVNILGNLFQQHFVMVHDSARGTIGFAKADCSPLSRRMK